MPVLEQISPQKDIHAIWRTVATCIVLNTPEIADAESRGALLFRGGYRVWA